MTSESTQNMLTQSSNKPMIGQGGDKPRMQMETQLHGPHCHENSKTKGGNVT